VGCGDAVRLVNTSGTKVVDIWAFVVRVLSAVVHGAGQASHSYGGNMTENTARPDWAPAGQLRMGND